MNVQRHYTQSAQTDIGVLMYSHTQTRCSVILKEHTDNHLAKNDGHERTKALDVVFNVNC